MAAARLHRLLPRLFASCIVAALLTPVALWARLQVDSSPFQSARLGGERLPPAERLRDTLTERSRAWGATEVVVHAGPYVARRSRQELGAALEVEAEVRWASSLGRSGNPLNDLA